MKLSASMVRLGLAFASAVRSFYTYPMTTHPLETYLHELRESRSAGVAETSYYGILANLLNEAGKSLKPKVKCVIHPKSKGAGIPDGGLFTPDQLPKDLSSLEVLTSLIPARGAIEVKGTSDNIDQVAASAQVAKYLNTYGQVLVTNYRDFVLVVREHGKIKKLEAYHLAETEVAFWSAAAHARKTAEAHGERLLEYLKRVMLHAAQLTAPVDVAMFIASYAREARARIEQDELPALANIRTTLEQSLGLSFEVEDIGGKAKADHFFRSTLVQTLFYGIFSAWVLWHTEDPDRTDEFHWQMAGQYLHLPVLQAIFWEFAKPANLKSHGLMEVLDWTGNVLNRVERATFFAKFEEGYAVQYFYEPFLQAFDPELRKDLGVVYTPPEIVQYQVARVDAVLREELAIKDGLADPRVIVLDPCCGTGPYVREVLHCIARTLTDRYGEAAIGGDVKRAAMERIFGFEILSAPFVIAHLQVSLLLQHYGAEFDDAKGERAAIYLTNSLTGWEPVKQPKLQLAELQEERDAANRVKQQAKILVIMGNPPYNGFAGVAVAEERDLSNAYRITQRAPAPQGQGLNDLYVRFFRMAERKIVEGTGQGIICFISNYSWLDGLSFTGMREHYLEAFNTIWIDCLNGDKYKTGKLTPDGLPDPSVFSSDFNPEGIQVGTAIVLLVKKTSEVPKKPSKSTPAVHFRHFWGKAKRADLLASLTAPKSAPYQTVTPVLELGLPLAPSAVNEAYLSWPLLPQLFPTSFPGVKTSREDVVVDIERERLIERMQKYFDPQVSHDEMQRIAPGAMMDAARFNAKATRDQLLKRGFLPNKIVRYCYRPFDVRWLYWESETKLLDEKRAEYFPHVFDGNVWLEARQKQPMEKFDRGYVTHHLADNFGNGLSHFFPLYLKPNRDLAQQTSFLDDYRPQQENLSPAASDYVHEIGAAASVLFYHVVAVLHAPAYRAENAGALRQDWPRVPLPKTKAALLASAELGRQIAALLDTEHEVSSVTSGTIRSELKTIGVLTRVGGGQLKLPDELKVIAGWGHAGQNGVTMPGKGKIVERPHKPELDIYLNDVAYWANIPQRVWDYTIGGYQVIKKWLSYREFDLLGRALTIEEARDVTNMIRRIAAIIALESTLNDNYLAIQNNTYIWK